jgi:hypothetical protein
VQTDKEKHAMEFVQETGFTYAQTAGQTGKRMISH